MVLCKCDRCNETITGKVYNVDIPRITMERVRAKNRSGSTLMMIDRPTIKKSAVDLCEKCYMELCHFTMAVDMRDAS